jgi:hypothetical protein
VKSWYSGMELVGLVEGLRAVPSGAVEVVLVSERHGEGLPSAPERGDHALVDGPVQRAVAVSTEGVDDARRGRGGRVRPLQLQIDGFTCFRDRQEIHFRPLGLFAITGPTGPGKSSLLDAITFGDEHVLTEALRTPAEEPWRGR